MIEIGKSYTDVFAEQTATVLNTARMRGTTSAMVVYKDVKTGEVITAYQADFERDFFRDQARDVKVAKTYRLRCKKTGQYRGAGGKVGKTGKVWAALGPLKNHIHASIRIDDYYMSRRFGQPKDREEYRLKKVAAIRNFLDGFECVTGDGIYETVVEPSVFLPEQHYALLTSAPIK